jgi:tRNA-binding protein
MNSPLHTPNCTFDDFLKVDIRTGTIIDAKLNEKARIPAYILRIDFGTLGIKTSSAQITEHYSAQALIGTQIVAVINFPPKRVAGVQSEVLVLAVVSEKSGTILLRPDSAVPNGQRVL